MFKPIQSAAELSRYQNFNLTCVLLRGPREQGDPCYDSGGKTRTESECNSHVEHEVEDLNSAASYKFLEDPETNFSSIADSSNMSNVLTITLLTSDTSDKSSLVENIRSLSFLKTFRLSFS